MNYLDAHQVAALLGLGGPTAVSVYRTARKPDGALRYPDFPEPVLPHQDIPTPGKGFYWWRPDVELWRKAHPAIGRNRDDVTPPS